MRRHTIAVAIALRDRKQIPDWAATTVGDFYETLGSLGRSGHLDIKLLWSAPGHPVKIWWTLLEEPFVKLSRAEYGVGTYSDWEWLVRAFAKMEKQPGWDIVVDAAWVAKHLPAMIENYQEWIRVDQALRSVSVASPGDLGAAPSAAAEPTGRSVSEPEV